MRDGRLGHDVQVSLWPTGLQRVGQGAHVHRAWVNHHPLHQAKISERAVCLIAHLSRLRRQRLQRAQTCDGGVDDHINLGLYAFNDPDIDIDRRSLLTR